MELSIPFESIQKSLTGFTGVQRRFTVRAEVDDILIVDDYGHHPVEIRATLVAAAEGFPDRKILAVFQPHRYSRVHELWDDFCGAFNSADEVIVCPVYAAGEIALEGVDHNRLAAEIHERGHRKVRAVADLHEAASLIVEGATAGDLVITLGAGNVNQVCSMVEDRLRAR
jgi:UDP-N-acetylmuramate--alanine ligase